MHNCNKTINIGMGCCHQVLGPIWDYYNKQEVDELIEDIITGDIDLSGYVTDDMLAEILEGYAKNGDLEALRQRLEEEVNKLSTELEKRAQKEDIEALEERVEDIETKIDDVEGVTEEKVNEMIKDKADKSELNDYQPKGDYATKDELDNYQPKGEYATKDEMPSLDGYATEQWVEDKNYLTEHQHLKTINGKSLIGDGNIIIEGGGESVDLSDYYTKEESDGRYGQKSVVDGLQSQIDELDGQLSTKADESALEALKQEIDELSKSGDEINEELGRLDSELDTLRDRVDSKADRSDLANYQPKGDYATKDELNDYQPKGEYALKSEIPNLDEYATKDEIPNLEGYATEQWVTEKNYLTEHQHLKTINGESLVGDGNIEIEGGNVDLSNYYTKEESDGRYGSKEEQESLRNDVEEALGESAKNEADLQKKADKEELDNVRDELEGIKNQIKYSDPIVKYMTKSEYESVKVKGKHIFYVIYDSNELWLGDNKLLPIGNGGKSEDDNNNYKALLTDTKGNEYKIECNGDSVLRKSDVKFTDDINITDVVIGDCVTTIEKNLSIYLDTREITSITLSDTVEKIENSSLNRSKITSLDLKNVVEVGIWSFAHSSELRNVDFRNVEVLNDGSFENCPLLYDIVLPSTVKDISDAFEINKSEFEFVNTELVNQNRKVRIYAEEPPSTIGAFSFIGFDEGITATYPIYVPDESVEKYKTAYFWSTKYADRIFPMSEYK